MATAIQVLADSPDESMRFGRIGVFGLNDTLKSSRGIRLSRFIRNELEGSFRFQVTGEDKIISWPAPPKTIRKLSRKSSLDLVLTGKLNRSGDSLKLTLGLFEGSTGEPFAIERAVARPGSSDEVLVGVLLELLDRLISRIPYKAMVVAVEGGTVRIDAGAASGLEVGARVKVFELAEVRRHPYTGEAIGFKTLPVGELIVESVSDRESVGRVTRREPGRFFRAGQKTGFMPSPAGLLKAKTVRKRLREELGRSMQKQEVLLPSPDTGEPETARLRAWVGAYGDRLKFRSSELDFDRKTDRALAMGLEGAVWMLSSVGVGASYRQASVQYDRIDTASIGVGATLRWFEGDFRYRHRFDSLRFAPVVQLSAGYHLFEFDVDKNDSPLLISYRMQGPFGGAEASLQPFRNVDLRSGIQCFPILAYAESSGRSGSDPKTFGYRWKTTAMYQWSDRISSSISYSYGLYRTHFSGEGSRRGESVSDARITEKFNQIDLGVTVGF